MYLQMQKSVLYCIRKSLADWMPIQNKMTYKEGKAMNFCENLRRCKEESVMWRTRRRYRQARPHARTKQIRAPEYGALGAYPCQRHQ